MATACLVGAPFAARAEIYSIELSRRDVQQHAQRDLAGLKGYADARLVREGGAYSLRAGRFCHTDGLDDLVAEIRADHPAARVVEVGRERVMAESAHTTSLPLDEFGPPLPVVMEGLRPYLTFTIPWSDAVDPERSAIHLELEISPLADDRSSVTVLADGVLLRTASARELAKRPSITVPLAVRRNDDSPRGVKVEIRGRLFMSGDPCLDQRAADLWLSVGDGSEVRLALAPGIGEPEVFLAGHEAGLQLIPLTSEPAALEAALRVATLAGAHSRRRPTPLEAGTATLSGRNVFIGEFSRDVEWCGNNLYLTPEGARLLVRRSEAPAFGDIERVEELPAKAPDTRVELRFADLGLTHQQVRGSGDLVVGVPFTASQLGGYRSQVTAVVRLTHTPIAEGDRGLVKFRLNRNLLEARQLSNRPGENIYSFELPRRLLAAENLLEVVFQHQPSLAECRGILPDFEATVFSDSGFRLGRRDDARPVSVAEFPGAFTGRGLVLLSRLDQEHLARALPILAWAGWSRRAGAEVDLAAVDETEPDGYDHVILVGEPPAWAVDRSWIDASHGVAVVNPASGKTLMQFLPSDRIDLLQVLRTAAGAPVIALSQVGEAPAEATPRLDPGAVARLDSNVAFSRDGRWYALEVGKKLQARPLAPGLLEEIWPRAKGLLLTFAALGIAGFFWYASRSLTGKTALEEA